MFDASGCLLLVPRLHTTRQFLEWYEVLSQYANDVDAVILRGGPCTTASAVQYCAAHGKLFTLGNDLDDEAAEHELTAILDTLAGRICAHEGIRPVDSGTNP